MSILYFLQYFLASLCDHSPSSKSTVSGIRARCPLVAEVRLVVGKLKSSEPVNAQGYQISVAVAVLKVNRNRYCIQYMYCILVFELVSLSHAGIFKWYSGRRIQRVG